jgi:uncharacterized protein YjbI with pentapeptide repeats
MTTREATRKGLNLKLDELDRLVLGVLVGLCLGAVGASLYFHYRTALPDLADWLDSVLQNAGTEMLGAFLTFLLIEVFVRKRRERDADERAIDQEKQRLILQMSSPDNAFAVEAARILQARGWGFGNDVTLQGVSLANANLQEAVLQRANLKGTHLSCANLKGARLLGADLQEAVLLGANFEGANLEDANLQEAFLKDSLGLVRGAIFSEETIMPDGYRWTPDTNLSRFIDPNHPDFWRSDEEWSPAFWDKEDDDKGDVR